MKNITIKSRLYILSFIPLLLIACSTIYVAREKMSELTASEMKTVHNNMMEVKKKDLKAYIEIIDSALRPLKAINAPREKAVEILSEVSYGINGYIFGYTSKGIRIFQGNTFAKDRGKASGNAKDMKGNFFIQNIIKIARDGGGFSHYYFPKPGETTTSEKLSYSIYEPRWDMVIGTGFYIDDIENTIAEMEALAYEKEQEAITAIIITTLIIAACRSL